MEKAKAADMRRGVVILGILAVLTVVEFLLATMTSLTFLLVIIAFVKAGIVIQYFMHLPRVFSEEGGH
jgi:cytochrome c oxidase subunit 4